MTVVWPILFLMFVYGTCHVSSFMNPDSNPELKACVGVILNKYFNSTQILTYFNFEFENDTLLDSIHALQTLSVSNRKSAVKKIHFNRAYMIVARNEDEFVRSIKIISKESGWNPYVQFLIVIDSFQDLKKVFDSLLQIRVYNVVVVNGTETAELYSYNPYENYACGKYYSRIIKFGNCFSSESFDLYYNKLVTGLRNCMFVVSCPYWPPYSVDPAVPDGKPYVMGTEQYVFHLISQVEKFKYRFVYNFDAEMFSKVYQNMSVSGPLAMLLTNLTDVMLGGLVLSHSRAEMFSYVHGHLDQVEEIRIMVKRASTTPSWKNLYLEFTPLVWALLLLVSVIYAFLLMMLLRTEDKGHLVLILLDQLFLHGAKFQARQMVNIIFIFWVWFAYLINCFYQSSLMSLTTKPSKEYQISDEQDLFAFNFKACISLAMRDVMVSEESNLAMSFNNNAEDKSCDGLLSSIKTVSHSENMFTTTPYTIYLYFKQLFYDEFGNSPVYSFPKPYTKVIYAMYFYKGFPMCEKLYLLALRIQETGLSNRNLNRHYYLREMKYHFHTREMEARFSIPWYLYIFGISISLFTFLVEVATRHTFCTRICNSTSTKRE